MRSAEPAFATAEPPASSRRAIPLLPQDPTVFVGRAQEVAHLRGLLETARLITVCGAPGIGKSRTAIHAARNWAPLENDQGGAWYCDLSAAEDINDLCSAVAQAFRVSLGEDPVTTLGARFARSGPTLIVLDNFEGLVEPAAIPIANWLEQAADLRLVITSRERLRLREEHVVELQPLSIPRDGDDALQSDAARLFVQRARAHRPHFEVKGDEHELLAKVVRSLEGNPLAIELAAARVDALGLSGLFDRMSQQLELLSRGSRGRTRQATLRTAIDASWQLLKPSQRRGLARMATFRGGFTLDAAEAVIGSKALTIIEDLRDRSLVRNSGPGRFALYETIREFAHEQLESSGDHAAAMEAHREFYLASGAREAHRFHHEGQPIDALAPEQGNLIAILDQAVALDDHESAKKAVLVLAALLSTCGPAEHLLLLLDRVRSLVDEDAKILHAHGLCRRSVGDLEGAEADLARALLLSPEPWQQTCINKDLGVIHHQRRQIESARKFYEQALAQATALSDKRLEGIITGNLGALAHDTGHFEDAFPLYQRALERFKEVGDLRLEGIFWTNLGVLEHEEGRQARARRHYQRALELLERTPDAHFQAIALGNLGLLEHAAGQVAEAKRHHEQALPLLAEVGDVRSEAWCRARLGAAMADLGETDAAEHLIDEAERLVIGRDALAVAVVRLHRCFIEFAVGDREAALSRLSEAQLSRNGEPSLTAVNDDARMLLRILARSAATEHGPRLGVSDGAAWFVPPGGLAQSLAKFAAARRILDCLVTQHEAGGPPLTAAQLFAAGWPGVSIAPQSANNRLYVQLAKLRKMGLKLLLLRTDDGYQLDPTVPVFRLHGDAPK